MASASAFLQVVAAGLILIKGVLSLSRLPSISRIEPATTTSSAVSTAGAPLHIAERVQLTDEVISRIDKSTAQYAGYFAFANSSNSSGSLAEHAASAFCKTFAGDESWPVDTIWSTFDALLGGALIPTVPIAASCYDTE